MWQPYLIIERGTSKASLTIDNHYRLLKVHDGPNEQEWRHTVVLDTDHLEGLSD